MPPELKAWVRELKTLAPPELEAEEEEEEALLLEAVDLEDPASRVRLAQRLARLEGVVGVVVAGQGGKEALFAGEPISLDMIHLFFAKAGVPNLLCGDGGHGGGPPRWTGGSWGCWRARRPTWAAFCTGLGGW